MSYCYIQVWNNYKSQAILINDGSEERLKGFKLGVQYMGTFRDKSAARVKCAEMERDFGIEYEPNGFRKEADQGG